MEDSAIVGNRKNTRKNGKIPVHKSKIAFKLKKNEKIMKWRALS